MTDRIASWSIVRSYLSWRTRSKISGRQIAQISAIQRGLLPYHISAVSSSLRDGPVRGQESSYAAVGANPDLAVTVFWGTEDKAVPFVLSRQMRNLVPRATLVPIFKGTHYINITHGDVIGPQLREFLLA